VGRMPAALTDAAAGCGGQPEILSLDDETFLHDLQPWPAKGASLCGHGRGAKRRPSGGGGSDGGGGGLGWLARVKRLYVATHDEFEDDGLLWFWYCLTGLLLCSLACCYWNCHFWCAELEEEEEERRRREQEQRMALIYSTVQ